MTLEDILWDYLNILLLLKLLSVKFSVEGLTCSDGFCGSLPALPNVLRSFCRYQLEFYLKEGASLLPHLFIYVFDYLFMSGINLVSGLPSSIIIIYFVAPKPFSHGPAFAECFLTSAPQDMGSYHIFPFFFRGALGAFYWRMMFRNQDLGAICAYCYGSIIAFRFSQQMELGNIYVCLLTSTHRNTHLHLSTSVCESIYMHIYLCVRVSLYI